MDAELMVLLTAATPVVELRGAIPLGIALDIPLGKVFLLSLIGNMIPVPFILLATRRLISWLSQFPVIHDRVSRWSHRKQQKLSAKLERWGWLGLFLFVAIPLPGTGAWTGAIAASLLGIQFRVSMLTILCGVTMAGLLVSGLGLSYLHIQPWNL